MPPIPRLGQGLPGGAASIPRLTDSNSLKGIPRLSSGRDLSEYDAPVIPKAKLTLEEELRKSLPATNLFAPSKKAYDLASSMTIIDRVSKGLTDWRDAQKLLKDLPDAERAALTTAVAQKHYEAGDPVVPYDELRALDKPKREVSLTGAIGNFGRNVKETVPGILPGIAMAANAGWEDVKTVATTDPRKTSSILGALTGTDTVESQFQKNVINPTAKQLAHTYGPALRGDIGTTASRIYDDPLGPLLDGLAIVSGGVGATGRISAATKAIQAGKVTRDASGAIKVGEGAGLNMKITQNKNGLWTIRNRGKLVYTNLADQEAAIAAAQSIVTGGVRHKDLEESFIEVGGVARVGTIKPIGDLEIDPILRMSKISDIPIPELDRVLSTPKLKLKAIELMGPHVRDALNIITKNTDDVELNKTAQNLLDSVINRSSKTKVSDIMGHLDDLVDDSRFVDESLTGPLQGIWRDMRASLDELVTSSATTTRKALGAGLKPQGAVGLGLEAATRRGGQGSLIDAYMTARGKTHDAEESLIAEEIGEVLDDPNFRTSRRGAGEVRADMASALKTTGHRDKDVLDSEGRIIGGGAIIFRETSDLVRAGAIYLRPAYIPNNWAGNTFLISVHQGVYAPINMAKSLAMDKQLGNRYARVIDVSMGRNAAQSIQGRGYVASATDPIAQFMGAVADQPFRRAAFLHEARRAGYGSMRKLNKLMERADGLRGPAAREGALKEIAAISRKAQEEVVKFGKMNDVERGVLRNLVFVYSWMRGAGRYAGRFPFQHAIQAAMAAHQGQEGTEWLKREMGGVPSFLLGAIPVGRDKDGNPILINPFSLNPIGTGFDIAQAAGGTVQSMLNPEDFNKFATKDWVSLLNPVAGSVIEARSGGRSVPQELAGTNAIYRAIEGVRHPGRGQVFPTSRKEALGQFTVGPLFPRKADQDAIDRSLDREKSRDPEFTLNKEMETFKEATGRDIPPEFVAQYRADLMAIERVKSFQEKFADKLGSSSFRNMPPKNQAKAGLEYFKKHHLIAPEEIAKLEKTYETMSTDAQYKALNNALWSRTGAGRVKRAWDDMMRDVKNLKLTRERK